MAAFADLTTNPANIIKYQNNPKILAVLQKIQAKLKEGGMPSTGGFPGLFQTSLC